MDIEISGVLREGDECIILKVVDDCNLWPYVLIDNTYGPDGKVSNINRHLFIFPNKNVSEGDYIAIYTKVGTNTSFTNSQGSTTHKFFWGYEFHKGKARDEQQSVIMYYFGQDAM